MIAERRYELILDVLHRQRSATVQQLARELGTSESTVRRDLIELDRQGWLSRVHGGAALKRQSRRCSSRRSRPSGNTPPG